jgi:hypothetical protein
LEFYNFRIDRNLPEKQLERLEKDNYLSMGWGGGKESNLDLTLTYEQFRANFINDTQNQLIGR